MKEEFKGTWMGKPLEEYSKEGLIEIIYQLDNKWRQDMEQHQKDLDSFPEFNWKERLGLSTKRQ